VDSLEIIIIRFSVMLFGPVLYCVLAAGVCVCDWLRDYWRNCGQSRNQAGNINYFLCSKNSQSTERNGRRSSTFVQHALTYVINSHP
jgi:hypothetical protein